MHLLSVDHFLSSKLEWGIYNIIIIFIYIVIYWKKTCCNVLYVPYSNFDDWKWSTDKRYIRNEITSYKIHTLDGAAILFNWAFPIWLLHRK